LRSALELPEASVLLNKLKAKRKKSTASLADVDAILEILEESWMTHPRDFGHKPWFIPGIFWVKS
jgi:hypothetical protein